MWAHVSILFFGVWLLLSPFIFKLSESYLIVEDLILGGLVLILGVLSCYFKARVFSVLLALVASWCVLGGYFFYSHPRPPLAENHIVVGLLILMFVLIPPDDKTQSARDPETTLNG